MLDKTLLKFLDKDQKYIYFITLIRLITLLLSVSIYYFICINLYNIANNLSINYFCLIIILIALVFKYILYILNSKFEGIIANNVQLNIRKQFLTKIFNLNGEIKNYKTQSLMSLGIEGVEQLKMYYTSFIPQFFYSLIAPLILFIIFSFINFKVALIFLLCIPLIPMSIIIVSKYAKKIFNKYWNQYLNMGNDFLDNLKGMKDLKIFDYDKIKQLEMDDKAENFRKITMKVLVMQLYSTSIMDFIAFGGAAIGIVVALSLFLNNEITNFTNLIFIILVGAEFFLPLRSLGSSFHISMNGVSAFKKIKEILDLKEKENGQINLDNINSISFNNVNLAYEDKTVLQNLNMNFTKNNLYGISGLSGSGKSSIVKALSFANIDVLGKITINNIPLIDLNKNSYFDHVAIISFNSLLFNMSIRDNFLLINPNISDEKIFYYLKMVKLDNFNDLDFVFNDENNLSLGQKQRFIISMYLSLDKDVYILDEATSNIDHDSEQIILNLVKQLSKNKIIILISHHLFNLSICNYIYYLQDNKICEEGDFSSLTFQDGEFKKLYLKQCELLGGNYNG
ncbi:MAG: ATP-binding cassette domain-containing protein [Bacilli bacterium]|nr:ATP-binding cassette domain-containing protein [Bacilli bacterium]